MVRFLAALVAGVLGGSPYADGWNTNIDWIRLNSIPEATKADEKAGKVRPVMAVVHAGWCHACAELKMQVSKNQNIEYMSKDFIMVNCPAGSEHEPKKDKWGTKFEPDGAYYPRIIFLTHKGNRLPVINPDKDEEDQHQYFYNHPDQVEQAMTNALAAFRKSDDYKATMAEKGEL
mmetsp:Transcript_19305/g.46473  ORF Transcript_19305/g.46473 Transcript_19305/m.46473 type:complete len:175 (-) Transcript_19305:98-622(-)